MATTDGAIDDQLEKIKLAELHHLFLACSSANADAYLGKANENGMSSFKFSWYILTKNSKVTCARCHSSVSVLTLRGSPVYMPMNTYVDMMDARMKSIESSISFSRDQIEMDAAFQFDLMVTVGQAMDKLLSTGQWRQINYTDCFSFVSTDPKALLQATTLKEEIKKVNRVGVFGPNRWKGDSAVPLITLVINRNQFKDGSMSSETQVGNWTASQRMLTFYGSITKENVKKSYRVVTAEEPPFVFRSEHRPANVKKFYYNASTHLYYYGYCIDLLFHINESMKFDFTLVEPPDHKYGAMQPDGSWNGMINELIQDVSNVTNTLDGSIT
ncbi:Ionotropic receptor 25a [Lamellibrachia satsuma]|nr:Ionotropic receptor 25a [Lamellibrachia satsuma]